MSVFFLRAQTFARDLTVRHPSRRLEALYRSLQGIRLAELKVWHAMVCQGFLSLGGRTGTEVLRPIRGFKLRTPGGDLVPTLSGA